MADPYQVLGIGRDATPEQIRKAYRVLAKKNHPDLHPGNKSAEAHFKEIASAYAIVGDDVKRGLYDSGKIDDTGADVQPSPQRQSYRQHAEAQPGFKYEQHWAGHGDDENDIFAEIFGRRAGANARGADIHYTFAVEFTEATNGAKKRVVMADGRTLDISIPAGLKDGQTLRLRGQGQAGIGTGAAGDVLVEVHVKPHAVFRRDGDDIRSMLPVTIGEALAGAKVAVETITGRVTLTIPKDSNSGTVLRLRGKGVPSQAGSGDHFVELRVVVPEAPDAAFVQSIVDWETKHPYDPRKGPGVAS